MSDREMDSHVDVLGWLHIAFGILSLLGGLVLLVSLSALGLWVSSQEGAEGGAEILVMVAWLMGGLLMLTSLPGIFGGLGLLRRRSWARILEAIGPVHRAA